MVGDGGAAAVKTRTGRASRWAAGSEASADKTVGAAQKWVIPPSSNRRHTRAGSIRGMHTLRAPTADRPQANVHPLQ